MKAIKKFLTTPAGSWVKVFVSIMVATFTQAAVNDQDFFSWDKKMWMKILAASIVSFLPMVINSRNDEYPLYGKQPKQDILVDNPNA